MAVVIPLSAVAYQSLRVPLSGRACRLDVQQRSTGLYAALWVDDSPVLAGVLCQDRTWLVRQSATTLPGDLAFADTQGTQDPDYTGLGSRFVLVYAENTNG
ncbi:MAG: hypothetical protein LKH76_08500 [Acetobacter fabarum]|jgi:hypothetical protein|uniref:phage baseplate plug family protein n=1 Tax=Acetobacter fabarum TaxID=483199 RepID=UPI00209D6D67|nr:hypothetical protein [Acetobacter fabarum]MCH4025001.1 hypothetical protein [Acetobacter fabarum]MCH4128581.1 hypothetical protein [Acetobacter fabarum]MCH4141792.1 hypothetical protein [Acetobacter fabarum]MCI1297645.1 hypothetical protein [Acetobacter fabarum]MCI1323006.1 hypothetical protein [Acetobacter fabarum]